MNFLAEDIWEMVREFIPEDKRKVFANNIIDMFEDEGEFLDYDDTDSQLMIDAGLNDFDEEDDEEVI